MFDKGIGSDIHSNVDLSKFKIEGPGFPKDLNSGRSSAELWQW